MNLLLKNIAAGIVIGAASSLTPYSLDKNVLYSTAAGAAFGLLKGIADEVGNHFYDSVGEKNKGRTAVSLSRCAIILLIPEISKRTNNNWFSSNVSYQKAVGFVALVDICNFLFVKMKKKF